MKSRTRLGPSIWALQGSQRALPRLNVTPPHCPVSLGGDSLVVSFVCSLLLPIPVYELQTVGKVFSEVFC